MPRKETTATQPLGAAPLAENARRIGERLQGKLRRNWPERLGPAELEDIIIDILNEPTPDPKCASTRCRVHIRPLNDHNTRVDRYKPSGIGTWDRERYTHQLEAIHDRAKIAGEWFERLELVGRSPREYRADIQTIEQLIKFVSGMSDKRARQQLTDAARIQTNDYLDRFSIAADRLCLRIERDTAAAQDEE